eukprot:gnl/MRDRNA2_/MRDRNA2_28277_c0_seq1.p1 gnl/MRDRNA2_/MRDRNA2_28277_c0~~gnl/MRDRNA2_/MRDRNA2_28277_c0_seq1.p1  ORF type:complete len:491 (+),score=73.06 gnl/MRDRNA2_/MRDRNA2_28277_c0_seq1:125-1597(+)
MSSNGVCSEELRIISTLSATTEIVCRLGLAHCLVGRSHGCDMPELAMTRPVVTAPKVDPSKPSAEIDAAVRAQAAAGAPVYHIYNASVAALKPTIIITQDQCRICAVTKDDVAEACALLPDGAAVRIVTVEPKTLDDVLADVITIASACGVPQRGKRLVQHMKNRLAVVRSTVTCLNVQRPKVAHLEWLAPLMGSGYWIAECVEAAGCEMICGKAGGNSAVIDELTPLHDADIIILAPCGFSIERTRMELQLIGLDKDEAFLALPAVTSGRCFVADGNKYFNRSSCGVVETAEMVAETVSPELLGLFGHHGQLLVNFTELAGFCSRAGSSSPFKAVPGPDPSHGPHDPPKVFSNGYPSTANGVKAPEKMLPDRHKLSPKQVVEAQLAALKKGDFDGAFALNSPKNQARLVSATKFASIVRGSSFNILLDPCVTTVVQAPAVSDQSMSENESAAVHVDAKTSEGQRSCFWFDLCKSEADAPWCTEGVRVEC